MNNLFEDLMGIHNNSERETREKITKSPFGYPGGKSRSVNEILPLLPHTGRYVEVFGGSGIILINRTKEKFEVFNDKYSGITDFYISLRDRPAELKNTIEQMCFGREQFIDCRDNWCVSKDRVIRGAMWYYMIQNSFGTQGRNFGRDLKRTTGKHLCNLDLFPKIHQRLKNVLIENMDWQTIVRDFDHPDTVFYMDPPYLEDICTTPGMYKNRFSHADHVKLLDFIFSDVQGFCAVSSYQNNLYMQYDWDSVHHWDVAISMKSLAFKESNHLEEHQDRMERGRREEYLYIKEAK